MGRTQVMEIQKGLAQVLLHECRGFQRILGFTHSPSDATAHLERGCSHCAGFAFSRDAHSPRLLISQFMEKLAHALQSHTVEKMAHALQSHITAVETEAHREVGVGGLQMLVDQVVNDSLHVSGIMLTNLGVHS